MTQVTQPAGLPPQTRGTDAQTPDPDALVGAVAHDYSSDPFPVLGIDHIRFVVGNARQAAHFYATAFGMPPVASRGPEQGYRDHATHLYHAVLVRIALLCA